MNSSVKKALLQKLNDLLDERVAALEHALRAAKDSRDSDTKSSAGDKYETGREMAQQEIDKHQAQLAKTRLMKNELAAVDVVPEKLVAGFGSLVVCDSGNYFLAVAFGKVALNRIDYFCLSLASPVGQALAGKRAGDRVSFNGKTISIVRIE